MTKSNNEKLMELCVMDLMEQITEVSKRMGNPKKVAAMPSVAPYVQELGKRFSITPLQALMLSLFVNFYPDSEIVSRQLAQHLNCTNLAVMACYNDIKQLLTKHYLCEHKSSDGIDYLVPMNAIIAFRENRDVEPADYSNMDGESIFMEMNRLFHERACGQISIDELFETLTAIINSNAQITFCQQINSMMLKKEDWILLIFFCMQVYLNHSSIDLDDIRHIFPPQIGLPLIRFLRNDKHTLQSQHIIEPAGEELASAQEWQLSARAAHELLGELCPDLSAGTKRGVVEPETITEKSLYYPVQTSQQVCELETLLMPAKFSRVQAQLESHNMRKGFACLFYGNPGTGKTETVLQLARKTGRSIMQVDMSQMRDKYVGESEKNVKQIFTRYRKLCRQYEQTPILLLNEADALLGVRLTQIDHASDQMENTIQNIILQEMETLDGILIATTNLTQNLDAAFDRRFLYKVEFQKPTAAESCRIWQSMLPSLSEENARILAKKYNFSGGQIENIARKHIVSNILHESDELNLSLIYEACDRERLNRQNDERIHIKGFC